MRDTNTGAFPALGRSPSTDYHRILNAKYRAEIHAST